MLVVSLLIATTACKKDSDITKSLPPEISTEKIVKPLLHTVQAGGIILSDGGTAVIRRGVCWSSTPDPTIEDDTTINGSGIGIFTSSLKGLAAQSRYWVRAYATTAIGTSYGNTEVFTTLDSTLTDIDNNSYKVVQIGEQVWMAENLRTTRYRNGDSIPTIENSSTWGNLNHGAKCGYGFWYSLSGFFYNGYAVFDERKLVPEGWHIPSSDEWTVLVNACGEYASDALREEGNTKWVCTFNFAKHPSGFSAVPDGYRTWEGYWPYGEQAFWWSSNRSGDFSNFTQLQCGGVWVNTNPTAHMHIGFSVRCIKD